MKLEMTKKIVFLVTLLLIGFIMPMNLLSIKAADETNTTSVESLGFSITTPAGWSNYLQDTDNEGIASYMDQVRIEFYSISNDKKYKTELYVDGGEIESGYYDGVTNLTNATDDQKKKLLEGVEYIFAGLPSSFTLSDEPTCEMVTVNDVLYIKGEVSYSYGKTKCIYDFYFTVLNGQCIDLQNYYVTDEEVDATSVYKVFDEIMQTVKWEDRGQAVASDNTTKTVTNNQKENNGVWEKINRAEFPLWIIWIFLAGILLWKVNPAKRKELHEDALSLDNSKGLLGFFALLIILHHMVQTIGVDKAGSLGFLENVGVCFVGIFFFFSGYGLYYSYKKKTDYLHGFLKKRMPSILVPFYVCILVFILVNIAAGEKFKGIEVVRYLSGFLLLNPQMWYVVEIALFYILFYLVFRLVKNENIAITVLGGLIVAVIGLSLLSGHGEHWYQGEWWYNTSFLFLIGIIFAKFKEKIMAVTQKTYWVLFLICVVLTVIFYRASLYMLNTYSYWSETVEDPGYADKLRCFSCQFPMVIFFVLSVLLLTMKLQFKNPILNFLGKISLELYLIHNLFIQYFNSNAMISIKSKSMYIIFVIAFSILLAWLLHGFNQYLIHALTGKNKKNDLQEEKAVHNHSIDCFRIIACFLVVCIHIPFRNTMGAIFIAFGKTAVPFFLVVCGYFLYREDDSEFFKRLKKLAKRIFLLTIFVNLLFMGVTYITMFLVGSNQNFINLYFTKSNIENFLFYNMSPFADHLWYLGSLLYALVILIILVKCRVHKYIMFLSPVLLGVYIYLSKTGDTEFFVYRNALLVSLPYVMMGCLIHRYEKILVSVKGYVYLLLAVILSITNVLEYMSYKTTAIPFYSAELLVYVIVLILLKYPNMGAGTKMERAGNKYSLFIYIAHIIPILYINNVMKSSNALIDNFGPIVIFGLTFVAAAITKRISKYMNIQD